MNTFSVRINYLPLYLLLQSLYEDHLFGDLVVTTASNNNNNNMSTGSSNSSGLLQAVADFAVVKPFSLLTKSLRYRVRT
jgi:hypothetical protein